MEMLWWILVVTWLIAGVSFLVSATGLLGLTVCGSQFDRPCSGILRWRPEGLMVHEAGISS